MQAIKADRDTQQIVADQAREEAEAAARAAASLGAAISRTSANDRIQFRLKDGQKFFIDPFPGKALGDDVAAEDLQAAAGSYGTIVSQTVEALNQYIVRAQTINSNRDLSAFGRAGALAKPQNDLVQGIAHYFNAVKRLEDATLADEEAMYRPPAIKAAHEATLDVEVRTWWRSLPAPERAKELQRLMYDPAGHDVLVALMRSPIPTSSSEMQPIAEVWRAGRRSVNPERSLKIDNDKEAAEWAIAALRMCAAVAVNLLGMKAMDVLQMAIADGDKDAERGAEAFGTPTEIARAKMLLQAARMRV